ncbi:MAG TPA: hypothetical protein VNA89_05080 [Gemmatimonadaceae bacterium]|nr:hypothetical protein [Gemmatimonadaceae bacterium]
MPTAKTTKEPVGTGDDARALAERFGGRLAVLALTALVGTGLNVRAIQETLAEQTGASVAHVAYGSRELNHYLGQNPWGLVIAPLLVSTFLAAVPLVAYVERARRRMAGRGYWLRSGAAGMLASVGAGLATGATLGIIGAMMLPAAQDALAARGEMIYEPIPAFIPIMIGIMLPLRFIPELLVTGGVLGLMNAALAAWRDGPAVATADESRSAGAAAAP